MSAILEAAGLRKVYRGGDRTDLACAPSCSPMPALKGGSAGPGTSPTSPASVASGIGGANVAASVVGNALKPQAQPPAVGEAFGGPGPS